MIHKTVSFLKTFEDEEKKWMIIIIYNLQIQIQIFLEHKFGKRLDTRDSRKIR